MGILILIILMLLFTLLTKIKISLPIIVPVIWLEVNVYGTTIIPELLCIFNLWVYIIGRILWISTLGTKAYGNRKGII